MKMGNLKIGAIDNDVLAEEARKTLEAQRGVSAVFIRPGNPGGADVEYDETHISLEQLVAKLRSEGYDAAIGGHSAGGAP